MKQLGLITLGLAFGFCVGFPTGSLFAQMETRKALQNAEALHEQVEELKALVEEANATTEKSQGLARENLATIERLQGELERARAELESARAGAEGSDAATLEPEAVEEAPEAPGKDPAAEDLAVEFGEHDELAAILNVDWESMGETVHAMNGMIESLFAKIAAGEEPSMEEQIAIARENQKLVQLAFEVIGKLPTHVNGNGEFTHPLVLANLSAAHLEKLGEPLSDAQSARIAGFGEAFEQQWQATQAGYGEATPGVQKVVDELRLKSEFVHGLRDTLTAQQSEVLTPESIRDTNRLDVLSPVVSLVANTRVIRGGTPEEVKSSYRDAMIEHYRIPEESLEGLDYVFDNWLAAVQPALSPTSPSTADFFDMDEALAAGTAHTRVLQDILASSALDDETRQRMLEGTVFPVPRLVE